MGGSADDHHHHRRTFAAGSNGLLRKLIKRSCVEIGYPWRSSRLKRRTLLP